MHTLLSQHISLQNDRSPLVVLAGLYLYLKLIMSLLRFRYHQLSDLNPVQKYFW